MCCERPSVGAVEKVACIEMFVGLEMQKNQMFVAIGEKKWEVIEEEEEREREAETDLLCSRLTYSVNCSLRSGTIRRLVSGANMGTTLVGHPKLQLAASI